MRMQNRVTLAGRMPIMRQCATRAERRGRGIVVGTGFQNESSFVGARSSAEDAAPTELGNFGWPWLQRFRAYGALFSVSGQVSNL